MNKELYHYGVIGMKWGIRRYQNQDGTLTEAGKKHRQSDYKKVEKQEERLKKSSDKLEKRQKTFDKRANWPTLTDVHLELKRRAGVKLANAQREYNRNAKKYSKLIDEMSEKYGTDNLPSSLVDKGKTWLDERR